MRFSIVKGGAVLVLGIAVVALAHWYGTTSVEAKGESLNERVGEPHTMRQGDEDPFQLPFEVTLKTSEGGETTYEWNSQGILVSRTKYASTGRILRIEEWDGHGYKKSQLDGVETIVWDGHDATPETIEDKLIAHASTLSGIYLKGNADVTSEVLKKTLTKLGKLEWINLLDTSSISSDDIVELRKVAKKGAVFIK